MKRNLPVTSNERQFDFGLIVTRTDLKGVITYANDLFCEISGFSRDELIGQSHNIVRHPDMPPIVFADLWQKMQAGQPWKGVVKNRCKNGDYYWVEAFVIPTKKNGITTGYMSVRQPAQKTDVLRASSLYVDIHNGTKLVPKGKPSGRHDKHIRLIAGITVSTSLLTLGWLSNDVLGHVAAGIALSVQAGINFFEAAKRKDFARLRGICSSIAEGRLNHDLAIHQEGECGELEETLAYMQTHLKVLIDELQMSARLLANGTSSIHNGLSDILERMESGTESINQISCAVEELSSSIEHVSSQANETSALSTNARNMVSQGEQGMIEFSKNGIIAMGSIESAQVTIQSLTNAISEISAITKTIRDIADQTNLLALNASIEAARAGEQGRGFAVVADEVRKLAERTSTSTGLINSMVTNISSAAMSTISTMATITETTKDGVQSQKVTSHHLEMIKIATLHVHEMMDDVAKTNTQQANTASELSSRMSHISLQLEESHRHVEKAEKVISEIASQSRQLAELSNQFELH